MSRTGHPSRIDREKPKAGMDRRAARTRKALHRALIQLIQTKDYEAISIGDIIAEADVGRSTFYAHYTGKDDLLRSAPDMMREVLFDHLRSIRRDGDGGVPPLAFSRFMFEHGKERLSLHRALFKGRAGVIVLERLRQFLAELLREDLAKSGATASKGAVPSEFAVQYLVGGFMSVLTWWLDRGAKEPPEEMDAAFRTLVLHGLGEGMSPADGPRPSPAPSTHLPHRHP